MVCVAGVEVARGPVDHGSVVDYTSGGSCQDSHDGTRWEAREQTKNSDVLIASPAPGV